MSLSKTAKIAIGAGVLGVGMGVSVGRQFDATPSDLRLIARDSGSLATLGGFALGASILGGVAAGAGSLFVAPKGSLLPRAAMRGALSGAAFFGAFATTGFATGLITTARR